MKPTQQFNQVYTGADGKESLYDLSIPENYNQKLILFIHGYMGYKDWGCWNLVMEFFNNAGYAFLKYNASHNGGTLTNPIDFSDLDSFAENNYSKEVEDFESIIHLIPSLFNDIPEIAVIGHSRGGGIALLQSNNSFVKKIVSWAGISTIANRFPKGMAIEKWRNDGVYHRTNGRTHQEMPHNYSQYKNFLKNQNRLNIELHSKNSITPTLIIHGDKDSSVHISEGEKISKWLSTDLIVIPGANHTFGSSQPWNEPQMPKQLLQVCMETLKFLNSEPPTPNEYQEKLSLLSQLVKLAQSGDGIKDQEYQFLATISKQLDIEQSDFEMVFSENIDFLPPQFEMDRILQFHRLVLLMNIDQSIDPVEVQYIRDLGIRMGLNPSATNQVLQEMKRHPNGVIPPKKLISIFKTQFN